MWSNLILFIIGIAVLASIYLVMQPKKSREQFALNVEQDYRNAIVRVFNAVLGRDPQEYEVQLYREYMKSPYDAGMVEAKLMASTEYADKGAGVVVAGLGAGAGGGGPEPAANPDKSVEAAMGTDAGLLAAPAPAPDTSAGAGAGPDAKPITSLDLGQRLTVYRSILTVYETNLDRLPTMKELNYYTLKMINEETFTISMLVQIIQSSKEYDILQKNQTNVVNAELPGSITDAQLTLRVVTIYGDMFDGAVPSKAFEDFCKVKFVEYQLDEAKFRKMLAMLHALDAEAAAAPFPAKDQVPLDTFVQAAANVQQEADTKKSTSSNVEYINNTLQYGGGGGGNANANANAASTSCEIVHADASSWQPYLRGNLCSATEAYNKDKFFDSLYTNLKAADAQQCVAGKLDARNSTTKDGRNRVAEAYMDREIAGLGYECGKTSELLGDADPAYSYDPNIVPQLRNTRFGTFLDDANNTKIGSILPKFIYKEYGYVN